MRAAALCVLLCACDVDDILGGFGSSTDIIAPGNPDDGEGASEDLDVHCTGDPVLEPHPLAESLCASSAAYLVDGSGFSTIQSAINSAGRGDYIYICPGTHAERLTVHQDRVLIGATHSADEVTLTYSGQILSADGDVGLYHLTFTGGSAGYDGGAVTAEGDLTVGCSTFTDNYADYEGGAIMMRGDLHVQHSSFSQNRSGYEGGAIAFGDWDPYTLTIEGSTFSDNLADYQGGAVDIGSWAEGDAVLISESTFERNSATNGGAIALGTWGWASMDIEDTTFFENSGANVSAIDLGGRAVSYEVTLEGVTIDGHSTAALEVGSRVEQAIVTLSDSAITSNSAREAVVYASDTTTLISNNTDWGLASAGNDNTPADLSSPCGTFSNLESAETFTCASDGTWTE